MDSTALNNKMMAEMLYAKQYAKKPPALNQPKISRESGSNTAPVIEWKKVGKSGELEWRAIPIVTPVYDYSTASSVENSVKAPNILNMFGIKIDLKSKISEYKENYMKNYALSKSHNLLMAKFADLKLSFYTSVLSLLGVGSEELKDIQKQTAASSIPQIKAGQEENEYTEELLAISGGSKKYVKTQKKVIGEIRNQLMLQLKNWGEPVSKEDLFTIKMKQCGNITEKLTEEKMNLQYQMDMINIGFQGDQTKKDIDAKLLKINSFLQKAEMRLKTHERALERLQRKANIKSLSLAGNKNTRSIYL